MPYVQHIFRAVACLIQLSIKIMATLCMIAHTKWCSTRINVFCLLLMVISSVKLTNNMSLLDKHFFVSGLLHFSLSLNAVFLMLFRLSIPGIVFFFDIKKSCRYSCYHNWNRLNVICSSYQFRDKTEMSYES